MRQLLLDVHLVCLVGWIGIATSSVRPADEQRVNLIPNGSFEVGLGLPFAPVQKSKVRPDGTTQFIDPILDCSISHRGKFALRMRREGLIEDVAVWVRGQRIIPGKNYSFAVWLRADRPGVTAVARYWWQPWHWRDLFPGPLGTEWQEFKGSFKSEGDYFYLEISASAADGKPFTVWMDDLCLVEGEPTSYVPAAPVEVGLQGSSSDERYYRGKPLSRGGVAQTAILSPCTWTLDFTRFYLRWTSGEVAGGS